MYNVIGKKVACGCGRVFVVTMGHGQDLTIFDCGIISGCLKMGHL